MACLGPPIEKFHNDYDYMIFKFIANNIDAMKSDIIMLIWYHFVEAHYAVICVTTELYSQCATRLIITQNIAEKIYSLQYDMIKLATFYPNTKQLIIIALTEINQATHNFGMEVNPIASCLVKKQLDMIQCKMHK
jgi:hypothetical protein